MSREEVQKGPDIDWAFDFSVFLFHLFLFFSIALLSTKFYFHKFFLFSLQALYVNIATMSLVTEVK